MISRKSTYWFLVFCLVLACQSKEQTEQNVFITDTGTKFHREDCRYLKFSKKIIELDSVQQKGFDPCKVCKPLQDLPNSPTTTKKVKPPAQLTHAIRCSANRRNGIQCKRMTKNPSGKCWQHEKK